MDKRKQFDEDKRHFDQEHQRYMEELEASMRYEQNGSMCVAIIVMPNECGRERKKEREKP